MEAVPPACRAVGLQVCAGKIGRSRKRKRPARGDRRSSGRFRDCSKCHSPFVFLCELARSAERLPRRGWGAENSEASPRDRAERQRSPYRTRSRQSVGGCGTKIRRSEGVLTVPGDGARIRVLSEFPLRAGNNQPPAEMRSRPCPAAGGHERCSPVGRAGLCFRLLVSLARVEPSGLRLVFGPHQFTALLGQGLRFLRIPRVEGNVGQLCIDARNRA